MNLYRFILSILILIIGISCGSVLAMQNIYNEAATYQNQMKLGNPNEINNFLPGRNANVSHLSNMSDQALISQGGQLLGKSEEGKLLQQVEIKKIDGLREHDINNRNPTLVNVRRIEADPLKHTEGSNLSSSETISKVPINKICSEGVEFEVDIARLLVLESNLIDRWGEWQDKSVQISVNDILFMGTKTAYADFTYGPHDFWRFNYAMVHEESSVVQIQLKNKIVEKLGINIDRIGDGVTVTYRDGSDSNNYILLPPSCYLIPIRLNYKYRDKILAHEEKGEYWQTINEESEKLTEAHECHEINRVCLDKGDKIFFNRFTVSRPCWKEQITYQCTSEPKDGCRHLKAQNCQLLNSNCLNKLGNICLVWQRNYKCFGEKKEISSSLGGTKIFCLGGDCHTPTIEQNTDIANVAYLAALNEIKNDMKTNPIKVFEGGANACRKSVASFLNCCSSMKGWGKDIGLGNCKAEEKALALKRDRGQCHFIGTYCLERDPIFRKCLTKKSSFCCFNSKLARIFQQQGKAQLYIGFGSAENSNCRGFTVEELQRIDFSKFDLEELFADLLQDAKNKMNKNFPKQISNQMPVMQRQGNNNSNKSY